MVAKELLDYTGTELVKYINDLPMSVTVTQVLPTSGLMKDVRTGLESCNYVLIYSKDKP